MHRNLFWIWESAIPKNVCESLLETIDWSKSKEATIENENKNFHLDVNIRKTQTVSLYDLHPISCIVNCYILQANISAKWNFRILGSENTQVLKYEDNGFYDWHKDILAIDDTDKMCRKLSCSLLLNDPKEFEGGNFKMENIEENLLTTQGSIIVFPSYVSHKVEPVTKGTRYSAVCWSYGPTFVQIYQLILNKKNNNFGDY